MEIEKKALEREKNSKTKKKINEISKEIANLKEKFQKISLQWKSEKDLIMTIRKGKKEIDQLKSEADVLERQGKLEKVAEIRYGKIPELEKKIKRESVKLNKIQKK